MLRAFEIYRRRNIRPGKAESFRVIQSRLVCEVSYPGQPSNENQDDGSSPKEKDPGGQILELLRYRRYQRRNCTVAGHRISLEQCFHVKHGPARRVALHSSSTPLDQREIANRHLIRAVKGQRSVEANILVKECARRGGSQIR